MDDKVKIAQDNWTFVYGVSRSSRKPVDNVTLMALIGDLLAAIVSIEERKELTVGDLEKYIGYAKEGYVPERNTMTIREFNKKVEEIKMLEQP